MRSYIGATGETKEAPAKNLEQGRPKPMQAHPLPASAVACNYPWLAHTGVEFEVGTPRGIPVILCTTANWHQFAGKSVQKRRKTPANCAITTPKTDRKYHIQLKMDRKNSTPPPVCSSFLRFSAAMAAFSVHAIAYGGCR
jgi:hypothetical protein